MAVERYYENGQEYYTIYSDKSGIELDKEYAWENESGDILSDDEVRAEIEHDNNTKYEDDEWEYYAEEMGYRKVRDL